MAINSVNSTGVKHIWDKLIAKLALKVDKETGKSLSTNDYTTAEKTKLDGIESGAQVNPAIDSVLSESSENPVQNKVVTAAVSGTKTATGNPVTLTDAAEINAEEVVASIEPIQDLHGYDKPWVGGAGKNKAILNLSDIKENNTSGTWSGNVYSINNGTITVLTGSDDNVTGFKANGTFNANTTFLISNYNIKLTEDTYIFGAAEHSDEPIGDSSGYYCFLSNINGVASWVGSSSSVSDRTFTITNTAQMIRLALYIASGVQLSNYTFYPMIRLSSVTDDTFEPYSNICPISGLTSVDVESVGKNLFDAQQTRGGTVTDGQIVIDDRVDGWISTSDTVIPRNTTTLYVSIKDKGTYSGSFYPELFDENHVWIDNDLIPSINFSSITVPYNTTFTLPSNVKYIRLRGWNSNGGTAKIKTVEVCVSIINTEYEPYKGTTTATSLGRTVYGGTLNVTTGVLTVDRGYYQFNGTETYSDIDTGWSNVYRINTTALDSNLKNSSASESIGDMTNPFVSIPVDQRSSGVFHYIGSGSYRFSFAIGTNVISGTKQSAIDWITANKPSIAYKLATPTTYQLTTAEVALLADYCTVSTNADELSVEYWVDNSIGKLKGIIDDLPRVTYDFRPMSPTQVDVSPGIATEVSVTTRYSYVLTLIRMRLSSNGEVVASAMCHGTFEERLTYKSLDDTTAVSAKVEKVTDGYEVYNELTSTAKVYIDIIPLFAHAIG